MVDRSARRIVRGMANDRKTYGRFYGVYCNGYLWGTHIFKTKAEAMLGRVQLIEHFIFTPPCIGTRRYWAGVIQVARVYVLGEPGGVS